MVKISVDFDVCKSSAMCCHVAEGVFQIDDKGYLQFTAEVDESRRADVEEAAELCPTGAITVE